MSISPKDSVMEGKKAVLTCESDANPPIYQYTWFDWNNQNLHHNHRMLRLDPVKVQHSGAYWCQGFNKLGVDRSPPSTLTVYCKALPSSSLALATPVVFALRLCIPDYLPHLSSPLPPYPARPTSPVCSKALPLHTAPWLPSSRMVSPGSLQEHLVGRLLPHSRHPELFLGTSLCLILNVFF